MAGISPYLAQTRSSARARTRIRAIEKRRRAIAAEDAELAAEFAELNAHVARIDKAKAKEVARRASARAGRRRPKADAGPELVSGSPRVPARTGRLTPDLELGLWGVPLARPPGLVPIRAFGDPVLDRAADLFRVPGLAHFQQVQIGRQQTFAGLDQVLETRDPTLDGVALSHRLCDAEIDLGVAQDLMDGDGRMASRLREIVEAVELDLEA